MNFSALLPGLFSSRAVKAKGGQAFAEGSGAPTNGLAGFCKGCDYTDTATGTHYINYGTVASSSWSAAGSTALFTGVTAGTVTASKGVVVGASSEIAGFGALSASTVTATSGFFRPAGTVAATGSTRSDAAAVTKELMTVTAADDTTGVVLPAATAGRIIILKNTVSGKTLKVYAAGTSTIDGTAGSTAYTLSGTKSRIFFCAVADAWQSYIDE